MNQEWLDKYNNESGPNDPVITGVIYEQEV